MGVLREGVRKLQSLMRKYVRELRNQIHVLVVILKQDAEDIVLFLPNELALLYIYANNVCSKYIHLVNLGIGWWVGFFNLQLVVGMLKVSKFRKLSEISLGAKKNYFGI